MTISELNLKLDELLSLPAEAEWVELKHINDNPQEFGEYISAISNAAALHEKRFGYFLWGIEDGTHAVLGTTFQPTKIKRGNEELENWLLRLLNSRVDFRIHEFDRKRSANHNVCHSRRNVNPGELFGRGVHPSGELLEATGELQRERAAALFATGGQLAWLYKGTARFRADGELYLNVASVTDPNGATPEPGRARYEPGESYNLGAVEFISAARVRVGALELRKELD